MKNHLVIFLGLLSVLGFSCSQSRYPEALEPDEALGSFQLDSAFTIELVAAEPMVMDPVEMVFDRRGRAYVVEMEDYPFKPEPGKAKGRIRLLEEYNGDGKMAKVILFADSFYKGISVLSWKVRLTVIVVPIIIFLKYTSYYCIMENGVDALECIIER